LIGLLASYAEETFGYTKEETIGKNIKVAP
jgi:hypothetical protein